ncbi:hypothetical protein BX666DRAFT_1880428 [Dichotomocladium elegans]|nr:hypothetical protein BX666DRAFT_1880428 [Dichotomocladium elegans]
MCVVVGGELLSVDRMYLATISNKGPIFLHGAMINRRNVRHMLRRTLSMLPWVLLEAALMPIGVVTLYCRCIGVCVVCMLAGVLRIVDVPVREIQKSGTPLTQQHSSSRTFCTGLSYNTGLSRLTSTRQ